MFCWITGHDWVLKPLSTDIYFTKLLKEMGRWEEGRPDLCSQRSCKKCGKDQYFFRDPADKYKGWTDVAYLPEP